MSNRICLDDNATPPVSTLTKAEIARLLDLDLGNPSSRHWAGTRAAETVELSRIRVANLIGCDPTEILFTSGGADSNNHAIKGVFYAIQQRLTHPHFIISSVEHPVVKEPLRFFETPRANRPLPSMACGRGESLDLRNLERRHAQATGKHLVVEELMFCGVVLQPQNVKQRQVMFRCWNRQLHRAALLGVFP